MFGKKNLKGNIWHVDSMKFEFVYMKFHQNTATLKLTRLHVFDGFHAVMVWLIVVTETT